MIVVSDTSPLCYLVLIDCISILPALYSEVHVSQTVIAELRHPEAPVAVRVWAGSPPGWLKIQADLRPTDNSLAPLHEGERTTISLAESFESAVVLLDDAAAREIALERGLNVSGLLGVLRDASRLGLVSLPEVVGRLRSTNFRASPALLKSLLDKG